MSATITFCGYNRRTRLARPAVEWFVSTFLPRHHLIIDILDKGLNREGLYGSCSICDNNHRPREFLIEMNNTIDDDLYLTTLFHEMIHVKQRVLGEYKTKYQKDFWFGKLIDPDTNYRDLPYEVEAHQLEESVTALYLSQGVL